MVGTADARRQVGKKDGRSAVVVVGGCIRKEFAASAIDGVFLGRLIQE